MAQPASQTTSDAPVDNPAPESAIQDEGTREHGEGLDEMYHTLGHLVAASDKYRADCERELQQLESTEQDLQKQRQQALESGDHMGYATAIAQLSELRKVQAILQRDAEDDLRGLRPSEHQDSDGSQEQRDGDGDAGGTGSGPPLADQADPGVGVGGGGAADGDERSDDADDGGSDSDESVRDPM